MCLMSELGQKFELQKYVESVVNKTLRSMFVAEKHTLRTSLFHNVYF
jgi:hypothetical protein